MILGLVACKFGSGIKKFFPSHLLEDLNDRRQPVRLGRSREHPIGAGDLVLGGISSPDNHPGTSGGLAVSAALNKLAGGSSDLDSVGQCHNNDIH